MRISPTTLPGVLLIEPLIHRDSRGSFLETWHQDRYHKAGIGPSFVQDNLSRSRKGTVRGFHFQEPGAQGKLISTVEGTILDVAVDVRYGSPHFARWISIELSAENRHQLWIPPVFTHCFCVLSEYATVHYKCTDYFAPEYERTIRWDDPDIAMNWPISDPILSERDSTAPSLKDAPALPRHGSA